MIGAIRNIAQRLGNFAINQANTQSLAGLWDTPNRIAEAVQNINNGNSSVIMSVSYELDNGSQTMGTLQITFPSGESYIYLNMPIFILYQMAAAVSRGQFFNRNIRPFYQFQQL